MDEVASRRTSGDIVVGVPPEAWRLVPAEEGSRPRRDPSSVHVLDAATGERLSD